MARVLPYPWSLLAARGVSGASLSLEDCETVEPLNSEILGFFSRAEDESLPFHAGNRHPAIPLTSLVLLNPGTAAGRRPGILSIPALPHEKSGLWHVRFDHQQFSIPVDATLRRAGAWEEPTDHNAAEVALRDTVDLLCGYFTEAIALTGDREFPEFRDYAGQALARLDWAGVWKHWKKVSSGEQPRMARVVEIASAHLRSIINVCEHPRRILVRQRELLPVGRVQELDSVCLRDLIRRPGGTVLEKAGPRQEMLGITRRETVDTAENRVIREFIRLCQHRARAYERENSGVKNHRRVKSVGKLRQNCERLDAFSPLSAVGRLVGAPRPNYVLQKDRRYHPLWIQYDKLRREELAVDNIWSWGRRLWADFIRGVVTSFLSSDEARDSCVWQSDGDLACYLRAEHHGGAFIPALSVSSRLRHRDGKTSICLVHPSHAHLCPGLEDILPRLGAELALVVYSDNEPSRPRSLLCVFTVLSLGSETKHRDAMAASLRTSLDQLSEETPGMKVRALLLRGEWQREKEPENSRFGRVDYLAAPAGSPFWFDLEGGFPRRLSKLLEELAE